MLWMPPRCLHLALTLLIAAILGHFTHSRGIAADTNTPATQRPLSFESDIRPIFKAHCWHCHGEADVIKGGLDLRQARRALKGGDTGAGLIVGNADASLIVERITAGEMPPGEKKLSNTEIDTIKRWIAEGAPTTRPEPDILPEGIGFTEEDRQYWAFQPIRRHTPPAVNDRSRVANPIDQFVLASLERAGLGFALEADRRTLAKRLSFNLLGLPADSDRVEQFVSDDSPNALERFVDTLLASPHYGERWGRHWLDAAGYADSDGYGNRDLERKYTYLYRDYVISSHNDDLPWNEFLVQQIAGDELLVPPYKNLAPEQARQLIATGFLRMAPDGTGDGEVEQIPARHDVVAETIKIVTSSVLGMTVGCAQCHDHRYDPISQKDYYRIRAIFAPALDPANWRNPGGRLVSLWHDEQFAKAAEVDREKQQLADERTAKLDTIVAEVFERELLKVPEERRELARAAKAAPGDKRTPEHNEILKEFPPLNVDRGSVYLYEPQKINDHNKKYDDLNAAIQTKRPPELFAHCLTEVPGQIPPTHLFSRGDFNQPREEIAPGELSILCQDSPVVIPPRNEALPTSGRRLAWARYLTSGRHPLVARVIVNRVWMHHFGAGLVTTPGDFGTLGGRPSHPELLDWLADEFITSGWSLKHLHRLIVLSTTYRQSSLRRPEHESIDPDNRLLGRANVRRLDAEALRDALLTISGEFINKPGGTPIPVAPDEDGQIVVAVDTRDSAGRPSGKKIALGEDEFRRSIYVQVRRSMPLSLLETFDSPDMRPNCTIRASSTVSPQALLLMNNEFLLARADAFVKRVATQANGDQRVMITLAWQLATGEKPTTNQIERTILFLAEQSVAFAATATQLPEADRPTEANRRAFASFCQALLCSNRVLYVD